MKEFKEYKRLEIEQHIKEKLARELEASPLDKDKRKASRIKACGNVVTFGFCPTCHTHSTRVENRCKIRLCPTCARILANQHFSTVCRAIDEINATTYTTTHFVTLTCKNVKLNNLRQTMQMLSQAYKRLINYKGYKEQIIGGVRTIEVTYNSQTGEYHPHIHAIWIAGSTGWFEHGQLIKRWRQALRVDYDPSVRVVKVKTGQGEVEDEVREVCKYTMKMSCIVANNNIDVPELMRQLSHIKTFSCQGKLEEIAVRINNEKHSKHDIKQCYKCKSETETVRGRWNGAGYTL